MSETKTYKLFLPHLNAFSSVDAETARTFIASAEEVKAQMIADGETF